MSPYACMGEPLRLAQAAYSGLSNNWTPLIKEFVAQLWEIDTVEVRVYETLHGSMYTVHRCIMACNSCICSWQHWSKVGFGKLFRK